MEPQRKTPDEDGNGVAEMHHREITLPDGRYMIFYTFGDDEADENEDRDV